MEEFMGLRPVPIMLPSDNETIPAAVATADWYGTSDVTTRRIP